MSDRTSGAWSTCSLDGLTAWTRPEPTKWAVVVKDGARAREANLTENTSFPWFVARAQNITTTAHFVDRHGASVRSRHSERDTAASLGTL